MIMRYERDNNAPWISAGYTMVVQAGPVRLDGRSASEKSALVNLLYHHFGDLDVLNQELLQYQLTSARIISKANQMQ